MAVHTGAVSFVVVVMTKETTLSGGLSSSSQKGTFAFRHGIRSGKAGQTLGLRDQAELSPLNLTKQEKADLVEFLKSLGGEGWQRIKAPEKFPQ
jgi:hypothetical protein